MKLTPTIISLSSHVLCFLVNLMVVTPSASEADIRCTSCDLSTLG